MKATPENTKRLEEFLKPLKGKNLACWCAEDEPYCHADVLLRMANPTMKEAVENPFCNCD